MLFRSERVIDDIKRSRVFTMQNTRVLGLLSVFSDLTDRIKPGGNTET